MRVFDKVIAGTIYAVTPVLLNETTLTTIRGASSGEVVVRINEASGDKFTGFMSKKVIAEAIFGS